ncbi:putative glycosyltransferase [Caenibius tardaugens NBRC 16725]|uniref:Putative glycosyltransferase n=1 Tax=Caenibius tardaugens NBRC 16725 TaxID=1219035 RepID=U2ZUM1_9SPHN|nr:glycosyltransferase [Caenibius tardaugens]AZI35881.1 glycosyltransferase [Caenibius tardaugens NBRC 16725]GAD49079.1 putative glycosyltransferase [Caenibius tardaugens NBRC 16725]
MPTPTLSVAMSVYNGERFLAEAIESILAQSFADFEFLILDDGSTDSSRAIIERYAARDPRIRPFVRENRGLIVSLNQLIDEAHAPLIARMDADDISLPHRFERQIAFLKAHPDYGVVGTWTEDIDENGDSYPVNGAEHPVDHAGLLRAIAQCEPLLCHPVVMFRRDIVQAVGGYHAAFRHCEDLDLWLRLANRTQMASIPERLIRYRHYPHQVSSRHAVEQQTGAAIARMAYRERLAGRPDPTATLETLPPLDRLDSLFGRDGVTHEVRGMIAGALLYSPIGMRGAGFEMLLRHLADGGSHKGLWRTVARLFRFGTPVRAIRLASALLRTPARPPQPQTEAA